MLKLSASLTPDSLTLPILQKAVSFEGIELSISTETSVDKNSRKMLSGMYDMAEMSFATFIRARMEGKPLIALPIFTGRRFVQPAIYCSPTASIKGLSDLVGKRVGLPQYWMTSSVWHRGILEDYYGVAQDAIYWVTADAERLESLSLPADMNVVHMTTNGGISNLIEKRLVDCVMLPKPLRDSSGWRNPFDALEKEQIDYYRSTGIFPIMHLVVISTSKIAEAPDLAERIVEGFIAAKQLASDHKPIPGLSNRESLALFGRDPWVYGIEDNWKPISTFLRYAHHQGLTSHIPEPDELFVNARALTR